MNGRRLTLLLVFLMVLALVITGVTLASQGKGEPAGPPLTVLVVGYGWYSGIPEGQTNNAETIALAVDQEMVRARDEKGRVVALGKVHSIVVPVTWYGAFPPVIEAIEELQPDIVVGIGTAAGITGLRVEPLGSTGAPAGMLTLKTRTGRCTGTAPLWSPTRPATTREPFPLMTWCTQCWPMAYQHTREP